MNVRAVRNSRAGQAWLALCLAMGLVVIVYVALSLSVSADPLLMPLDDTYIHFQYARQWAHGDPMVYNPGDPATSGGTSLLYPPLLAVGYLLGFTGWSLAYWALGIGALGLLGAAWLVYLIGRANQLRPEGTEGHGPALAVALAFAVSGPFVWAALSGMETSLFVFTVLLALYLFQRGLFRLTVLACVLLPLVRPEGLILAGIAVGLLALHSWPARRPDRLRRAGWLALPLLAGGVQPVINLAATGSMSSSGLIAKSHLYNTSVPFQERVWQVLKSLWRMWEELITGTSTDFGRLTPLLLAAFAVILLGAFAEPLWQKRHNDVPALILLWMLALSAGVATLDTAFWQFRRYQLPVIALMFPVAAWGAAPFGDCLVQRFRWRGMRWALPGIFLISSALTTLAFAGNYTGNVRVVRDQQVPMARWVRDHLPEEARVGVHDVGLVRYFGDRALYDVVGLTTPGPAKSWRQGPGAIYEHMASSPYRPDYFAIYPDVQGLTYLRDAGIFGEVLAEFPVDLGAYNVAAAADYQAVYRADWATTRTEEQVAQTTTWKYLNQLEGWRLVDQVDVANLDSEAAHNYRWWQDEKTPGFVTEVYHFSYRACDLPAEADCWATDGGRVLTGGEEFTLNTQPGEDLLLVTRVHGRASVPLTVYVNGKMAASRVQPEEPGYWLEVVTLVPAESITGARTRIRLQLSGTGVYSPYYHWAYQGTYTPGITPPGSVAEFGPDGGIRLIDYSIRQEPGRLDVVLYWAGTGAGDGVVFVHLYYYDRVDTEPAAQAVSRPAKGVLPPGNWLPGTQIHDTYTVILPNGLMPGEYVVAVGLFDARTGSRYPVMGQGADEENRLFIGEIILGESGQ